MKLIEREQQQKKFIKKTTTTKALANFIKIIVNIYWESHPFWTAIVRLEKPVCVISEGKK